MKPLRIIWDLEVMNRFKGLDLVDCLKNYGQFYNIA